MRVLFITIAFPKKTRNIYGDLVEELYKSHHKITVLVADNINEIEENNIKTIRVKTSEIYNVNVIKKAMSFITLQSRLIKAIKKHIKDDKYDLILFLAPPVTIGKVVKFAMKKFKAESYLMQKDIFPQNAIDLKILQYWNPMYWYFRRKEKQMYKVASKIGCMSQQNIKYILEKNRYLNPNKLELFPNTFKLNDTEYKENQNIKNKYNIKEDKITVLYGGNFGKPQGIDFIKKVLEEYKDDNRVQFIFCGKGTEKNKLYQYIKNKKIENVYMTDFIQSEEYNQLLQYIDIGLIFLDYRFTIPNVPSKTLSYFENSIPIMAATDKNTDYKDILVNQAKAGLWCESNNIEEFKKQFDYLITHKEERIKMGQNGRRYLEEELTTKKSVQILEKTYYELKKEGTKNV